MNITKEFEEAEEFLKKREELVKKQSLTKKEIESNRSKAYEYKF